MLAARRDGGVGQEHDRRLEALARVDGQHPHAVAFRLEVALDLRLVLLDLGEKAGQRRRFAPLVGQRQREELVDRLGGVVSEPGDQRLATAVLAEEAGVESVGRRAAPRDRARISRRRRAACACGSSEAASAAASEAGRSAARA